MAIPSPRQQLARDRIEGLIGLAAPFLDLVLSVGERISRTIAPEDDYYPIRSSGEGFELGRSDPAAVAASEARPASAPAADDA